MNKIEKRWGLRGVAGALRRVTQWVERDIEDGYVNEDVVHLVLDAEKDPGSVEIVSILSDGAVGDLAYGPVIRLARALQPIAAITVNATYAEGEISGAVLSVEEAGYLVTDHSLERCDGIWRLSRTEPRDIRNGNDFPLIPEHWDAAVALGLWMSDLEYAARNRTRGSTIH
jgi:hypothetical protein